MIDFTQVDEARRLLGLGSEASIEEIKDAYRRMSLCHHPDRCGEGKKEHANERMKEINRARDILMAYCVTYRVPLTGQEAQRSVVGHETYDHLRRFYDGWLGDLHL